MSAAFYNEVDPFAAQWLRNLIAAGMIAPGVVDERSVEDIQPDELHAYTQCHFFAGIGGWSYALRLAGWPDARPVWTGSCPCQPFSTAGKRGGFADERHLWPAWHHLIQECGPAVVFGEQVASGSAGEWLDLVQDDLEGMGYAFGAVAFPAAGLGAPHIRDRLYWVANTANIRCAQSGDRRAIHGSDAEKSEHGQEDCANGFGHCGTAVRLADTNDRVGCDGGTKRCGEHRFQPQDRGVVRPEHQGAWLGVAGRDASPLHGQWADADWLACRDGKWRPVEPGTFPLAHGAPARVGRLRGYGEGINAEVAAAFIKEVIHEIGA